MAKRRNKSKSSIPSYSLSDPASPIYREFAAIREQAIRDNALAKDFEEATGEKMPSDRPQDRGKWVRLAARYGISLDGGATWRAIAAWVIGSRSKSKRDDERLAGRRRKAGRNDGRRVKAKCWVDQIADWIKRECHGKWSDGIPNLHKALADLKTGIGFNMSEPTLWRYSKDKKLKNLIVGGGDTSHLPRRDRCSGCGKRLQECECEKLDAYTMPNDPD